MFTEDLHVHTKFSTDSNAIMQESVCAAIKKGITKIAFTEHLDLDYPEKYRADIRESMGEKGLALHPDFETRPLFTYNIDAYFHEINTLKEQYKGQIEICAGVEIGMRPNRPDLLQQYRDIVSKYPFQVILGSVHLIDGEDPYYRRIWKNRSVEATISLYFKEMLSCVRDYDFITSLSHIDYPARYIPAEMTDTPLPEYFEGIYDKNSEIIDEILKIIINRNQALEINTKGLFTGLKHAHPSDQIIKAYERLGGTRFTRGSDAHKPEFVGDGLNGI